MSRLVMSQRCLRCRWPLAVGALLAVLFAAAAPLPTLALQPCALIADTGVRYSQVPRGWTPEAWSDSVAAAFPDGAERPVICLPPPDQGDYAIGNPIPEVGIDKLGYTARDWERWDGFDVKEDLLYTPTRFGSDNEAQLRAASLNNGPVVWGIGDGSGTSLTANTIIHSAVPLSASAPPDTLNKPVTGMAYLRAFRANLMNLMYPRGYVWFRGFQKNDNLDWIVELGKSGRLDMTGAHINVSFALNENYNNLRKTKRAAIRDRIVNQLRSQNIDPATRADSILDQIDAEWDAYSISNWLGSDMPRNQATLDWFERLLVAYIGKMCLTPGTMVTDSGRQFDAYGLFQGLDGPGYSQNLLFFYAHEWAHLAGRWVKLLRTPIIREVRKSMYASLSASYASYIYRQAYEDRLSSQWIMRIAGFTSTIYTILRSEAVLKARGDWQSSDDPAGSGPSNWAQGKITKADMLQLADSYLGTYVTRMQYRGMTEDLSTYYGLAYDILTQAMTIAPSQSIYDKYERVWKMYNFDTYTNFHPAAAAVSGPSGRHYDVTTGLHGKQDYWDTPVYISILFPPSCAVKETKENWDGSARQTVINLCTAQTPSLAPLTGSPNDFSIARMQHSAIQAAGLHYLPFDAMFNHTIGKQARINYGLTTNVRGQERYNFFSPLGTTLAIGYNAEEIYGTGTANVLVARLGGVPVPGSSRAVIKQAALTQVHAYLRYMVENEDQPFYRNGPYGVVSHEMPELARFVNAQHQGFLLTTSLVAGRADNNGKYDPAPWNSDIILPVTVDSLWADNTRLPVTAGTVIALPRNVIITARHKGSSFAIRILHMDVSESSSGIKHASSITTLSSSSSSSTAANYLPTVGKQEYSVTWQVDSASLLAGCGRVTIHHKHKGDTKVQPWRVSTLWGSGVTSTNAEMFALQRTMRHAVFTESLTEQGGWDASDQPTYGRPKRSWDGSSSLGQVVWSTAVQIGPEGSGKGGINLKVVRTDVYQPNTNDAHYRHPTAPMNGPPYYVNPGFERTAQGSDIFAPFFSGFESDRWTGQGLRSQALGWDAILAPHLTSPPECVVGVDSPCYQWRLVSEWASCSASCRGGVQTRTVRCADASASNPNTAVDDSLCFMAAKPATVQSCNTQPCLPGPPSIERVQALDGYVRVWWGPPADNGGDPNPLRYLALTAPNSVATTAAAATSPMLVGPLTNGQSYTVRLAAVNSAGTGAFSSASASFTPDKFSWKYSDWSACSRPCGSGGEQTRTVSCAGAATGPASDDMCNSLVGAAPTDLRQSCSSPPCVWSTGSWSSCSRVCSTGTQTRDVVCTAGTDGPTISNQYCTTSAPASSAECNTQPCAWVPGTWSSCNKICGGGTQTRSLTCADGKGNTNLPTSTCQEVTAQIGSTPPTSQSCNTQACLPNQWRTGAWGACSEKCGPGGSQTRSVDCQTAEGLPLAASECPANTKPPSQQSCNTQSCEWRTMSDWSACSDPCNGGTRTRTIACVEPVAGSSVPSERCAASGQTPLPSSEVCNTRACGWASSPWGVCSASCGVGTQTRRVWCSDGSSLTGEGAPEIDAKYCANAIVRPDTQECGAPLLCVTPPGIPTITLVEAGNQRATVYFAPASVETTSTSTNAAQEYIVNALPIVDDSTDTGSDGTLTDGGSDGTAPVQSSFEVVATSGNQPTQGALELDDNGNPIVDKDAPAPGAMPPLAALTSWARESPIVILGLVNGVRYRFTIVAVNTAGNSDTSPPSEPPVRPYSPPSSPPKLLRVALLPDSEGDVASRRGSLLLYFDATNLTSEYADTPAPSFVATAVPQLAGQIVVLSSGTRALATNTMTTENSSVTTSVDSSAAWGAAPSVNGTTSPLLLTGLDPSVQYRLTLTATTPAGSSPAVMSQGVYRADPDAPEWLQAGHGNEAGQLEGQVPDTSSQQPTSKGSGGISSGGIAAAVIVPLLVAAAVGGGLFWRWQRAKDRRTGYGTSSAQGSPDASRDASRETSRSKGAYQAPQLQPHAEASGDLEADQQRTLSPLANQAAAAALTRQQKLQEGHVRRRSSHVQVNIDDMKGADIDDAHRVTSRTSTQVPNFHERDNPLSPAGAAAARGIAASIGQTSPAGPLASPSLQPPTHEFASYPESSSLFQQQQQGTHFVEDASTATTTTYALRPTRPPPLPIARGGGGPVSPPQRTTGYASVAQMSPPPLPAGSPGGAAASPSPSPSPEPQAPFLRRPGGQAQ